MKQAFFIWLLFFVFMQKCFAEEPIGHFYELKAEHELQESDINGVTVDFIKRKLPAHSKFTIVNRVGDNYMIRFWNWGKLSNINTFEPATKSYKTSTEEPTTVQEKVFSFNIYYDQLDKSSHQRYFQISTGDLSLYAQELESNWSPAVGVATLPFKARPITGEFTKDISISGLGGFRHKGLFGIFPSSSWSTLFGVGIASVTLDSANTNGNLKKSSDFAAVSLSIGEVIEWKKLQVGVFIGWDKLKKSDVNGWRNQGNLWWGMGIGFSIFSESTPQKEGTNKTGK